MSRRPGIGETYVSTHTQWHVQGKRNYTQMNGIKGRIPRYYKDRIFSEPLRQAMAAESIALADEQYNDAVEKFSKFHDDPYYYYDERIRNDHDSVYDKINSKDMF